MRQSGLTAVRSIFRHARVLVPGRVMLSALTGVSVVAFLGYHLAHGEETDTSYDLARAAQQGQHISPVPLELANKRPQLVYRGSYLVNALGSCNSCHTCPSYRGVDPYQVGGHGLGSDPTPVNSANFLAGGTPFQNSAIVSPSLAPDSSGKPGGMTYQQFKLAMHDGQDSHNSAHILQVMPWPIYRNLDENDFRAIYLYLSSIPPAPSGKGQCSGPDQTK